MVIFFNQPLLDFPNSGIKVKFEGKSRVHWTEQHHTGTGENRRSETRHYTSTVRGRESIDRYVETENIRFWNAGRESFKAFKL